MQVESACQVVLVEVVVHSLPFKQAVSRYLVWSSAGQLIMVAMAALALWPWLEVKLEGAVAQALLDRMGLWAQVLVELEAKAGFGPSTIQLTPLEGSVDGREFTQFSLPALRQILGMAAQARQM
jgi:hypothetical protein